MYCQGGGFGFWDKKEFDILALIASGCRELFFLFCRLLFRMLLGEVLLGESSDWSSGIAVWLCMLLLDRNLLDVIFG